MQWWVRKFSLYLLWINVSGGENDYFRFEDPLLCVHCLQDWGCKQKRGAVGTNAHKLCRVATVMVICPQSHSFLHVEMQMQYYCVYSNTMYTTQCYVYSVKAKQTTEGVEKLLLTLPFHLFLLQPGLRFVTVLHIHYKMLLHRHQNYLANIRPTIMICINKSIKLHKTVVMVTGNNTWWLRHTSPLFLLLPSSLSFSTHTTNCAHSIHSFPTC